MRNMEWKKYELEELMEKSGIVRGPFGGMLKKEIFVDKGYKVYEQKNAINSNYVDGRYYVTKEKYNELSRFKVRKNDFIVSCSGTIGKIYKIPEDAPQGIINQALLKLTINTKILDIDFFEQYFKWESFQDKIMENSQGGAIKNLVGMKTFRKIELLIPSLKEQKKIAEILSTWDDAINLKKELLEIECETFQKIINKLTSNKNNNSHKFKEKELGNITNFVNGYAFSSNNYDTQGKYGIVTISNVQNGKLKIDDKVSRVSEIPDNLLHQQKLSKNDILISMTGNVGRICIVNKSNLLLNQRVGKIIPKDNISYLYLYYALRNKSFLNEMIVKAQGGAQPNLSTKDIKNYKINVPSFEYQEKIGNYLRCYDKKIELLNKEIKYLTIQKQGLMQQLLSGKIRVNTD